MRLWVEPSALDEIAALPGHMRQRVRRVVSDLGKAASRTELVIYTASPPTAATLEQLLHTRS